MICSVCKVDKPESEFNWSKRGVRRQERCRECCSEYNRRRYAANPEKFKAAVKRYRQENPDAYFKTRLKLAKDNPTKHNVHKAVEAAVQIGVLQKPERCSKCGCHMSEHRIEAHHDDYSKPLEVVWLCTPCHRQADADRRRREGKVAFPACQRVAMLDGSMNVIRMFESQKAAADFVRRAPNSVSQAIKNGGKCGGYYWKKV